MTTTVDRYALGRTPEEYERLRAQSRVWEAATARLFDQVGLFSGARCLDAGSGPGETMRTMAQRVGPEGWVLGVDVDEPLGALAVRSLHAAGHHQCAFECADVSADRIPGGPFDLVFARLLLFHVHDRVGVLRRLWDLVAPGGHLVVQDYDVEPCNVEPELETIDEFRRVVRGAFEGAGCDVRAGHHLPLLFAEAGIGAPDGSDVAGRLESFATASAMFGAVYRSVLPGALALGLTTEESSDQWFEDLALDAVEAGESAALWPLMIGAWKQKA
jgi:SAM-dependent methyltransferase